MDLDGRDANFIFSLLNLIQFSLSTGLGNEGLRSKAIELWENVVRLETEKYDLEMRRERQGYDVSEEYEQEASL